MSEDPSEGSRKRPREDDQERSDTIYLQCKHISKPWDLLNSFLAEHRETLGMQECFETKDVEGVTHTELKHDAPVEIAYAFWSRKPFFLIEFRGERRAAWAAKLLGLTKIDFRGAPVSISLAKGTSVAQEKEKVNALGGVPKHHTTQDEKKQALPQDDKNEVAPPPRATPSGPTRPTTTTFLPRALWKR
jgi:hypothetical protein